MKKIFVIDWYLVAFYVITMLSGFKLHMAGHFESHEIWLNWDIVHTVVAVGFVVCVIMHIKMHWGWYKSVMNKGLNKKSRMTIGVSLGCVVVAITGITLLVINGANTGMGLWHYKLGILFSFIAAFHIVKRFAILKKSLK